MIKEIVKTAGKMMLNGDFTVHDKAGMANFVTDNDVRIQKYLIRELEKIYPDCGFFGEEETERNDHRTSGLCFYIDPIDGTTNYIFGYNHSCVSVGVMDSGEMIAGYVYNPFTDEMYEAEKGKGAYLNGRRLRIQNKGLSEGIVAFGCARYNEGDTDALFSITKELYLKSLSIRNGGSAALDLCRVASGSNVIYLELMLQPYDYSAASVIISEAGGVIEQVDGLPITMDKGCPVLAGTPKAVKEARKVCEQYL